MPTTLTPPASLEDRFVSAFDRHAGHSLNGRNPALHALRQTAMARFTAMGFPAHKAEAWKYTNIRNVLAREYALQVPPAPIALTAADVDAAAIPGLTGPRAVLVNGRFDEALSSLQALPDGVVVCSLAAASERHTDLFNRYFAHVADVEQNPFAALNTAFAQEGLFVYVPARQVVEVPLQVIHLSRAGSDLMTQPRALVVAEEGAQVRVVEIQHGGAQAKTLANALTECHVGARAMVTLYKLQDEGPDAARVDTLDVYQEAESTFTVHTTTLSGDVVRNNIRVLPDAEQCETHMFGLFLGDGTMHVDNHTLVDHAKPQCFSNELYKGVLDDRATGVFNGKVLVRRDAQQINAYQSNKTVVLKPTARMFTKPELEIYADDVKCSHGATTGQVDPEAVFYLRSRGLSTHQARLLLLEAFARDVLEPVRIEALRTFLDARVARQLGGR